MPHFGKIGEGEYSSRKPGIIKKAQIFRRRATDAEKRLWYFLQKKNLGYSFRRQHPVGPYIVDFICLEKGLIVELDGGQHAEQRAKQDMKRTVFLEKAGYRVIRFWNNDVLQNTQGVCESIQEAVKITPHLTSPRKRGEDKGMPC